MIKISKIPNPVKRIIFIALVITLFFGIGVIAGNLKPINSIKIAFSNNHSINVLTTKSTVDEILKENHIEILEDEIVVPSLNTEIKENATIKILKKSETNTIMQLASKGENISLDELLNSYEPIVEKIVVEKVKIPYETVTKDVSNGNSTNTKEVIQEGEDGIKEITYRVKYQNEVELERQEIKSKVIKESKNKVVQIKAKTNVTSRDSSTRTTYVPPTGGLASKVEGKTPKIVTLNTSAYCSCYKCCGKQDSVTASGAKAQVWYTVAAGKGYPMGTIIYIPALKNKPNGGWFVVQDRGGAITNNKLDIFVGSHSEANDFGRRNLECYIYV